MKLKVIPFLALFAAGALSAQMRFVYQMTMKPDSLNRNEVKTELANLDVSPEKSVFYAETRLKRDSIMNKMRQTRTFDRSQMQNLRSNIDYIVEKNPQTGVKTFRSRIGRDEYSYDENQALNWKILPETSKIGDYKVQKAETDFGGRKWTAWFTTDIPFQDGPYKFSGLPGLIVKAEDSKGDYSFDLKEARKNSTLATFEQRENIVKVKREAFMKQLDKYRKDPVSFMQAAGRPQPPMPMNGGGNRGGGGSSPDPAQRKAMQDRMLEEIQKNNNPIELK